MDHLKDYLQKRRDIYEPAVKPDVGYKNYLMLGYYRNPLNHIFFNEGVIITSMLSFGADQAWNGGVDLQILKDKSYFLAKLLQKEEVLKERMDPQQNDYVFNKVINMMLEKKIIQKDNEKVFFKSTNETYILFVASLIWPMIDSYFATVMFTISLVKNKGIEFSLINKKI